MYFNPDEDEDEDTDAVLQYSDSTEPEEEVVTYVNDNSPIEALKKKSVWSWPSRIIGPTGAATPLSER